MIGENDLEASSVDNVVQNYKRLVQFHISDTTRVN